MMLGYELDLALRSFRRNKVLTLLMVLAIALGIGAAMTTLTVYTILAADPLPGRSDRLYIVHLDPYEAADYVPGEEPTDQLTRYDAEALLREKRADRQALMTGGFVAIQPEQSSLQPFRTEARFTSADFFAMFGTPFASGGGWSAADDEARARVAVISQALARKLFGAADAIGRVVRMGGADFRIVGVMAPWRPVPHFYDLYFGKYAEAENVFVPFSTSRDLKLERMGTLNCWGRQRSKDLTSLEASCVWMQYWVQLDSADKVAAYRRYLDDYSAQQKAAGRYERPPNTRLYDVMQYLRVQEVVPEDVRLQVWLAFGFLGVCLLNTVGLLLAKCLRRSPEIGVRRALGASRRRIFLQFLVEAGVIGLAGGALGLVVTLLGLWGVRHNGEAFASLASLDLAMLGTNFAIALAASLAAGLLPAWRACEVTPALQLKSQ
jgi:putative ABC transport system permease protein